MLSGLNVLLHTLLFTIPLPEVLHTRLIQGRSMKIYSQDKNSVSKRKSPITPFLFGIRHQRDVTGSTGSGAAGSSPAVGVSVVRTNERRGRPLLRADLRWRADSRRQKEEGARRFPADNSQTPEPDAGRHIYRVPPPPPPYLIPLDTTVDSITTARSARPFLYGA